MEKKFILPKNITTKEDKKFKIPNFCLFGRMTGHIVPILKDRKWIGQTLVQLREKEVKKDS